MSSVASTGWTSAGTGFRHEAVLYPGEAGFVDATAPFVEDALAAGEPALVMVPASRIELLRSALGADADRVHFADMGTVGQNPARIIPAWQEFVTRRSASGRPLRGIGEPVWADRRPDELVECHRHEALLNRAFADAPAFWLLCPYDATALDPAVLTEAARTHPYLSGDGGGVANGSGDPGVETGAGALEGPLPEPPPRLLERGFDIGNLDGVRELVSRHAVALGCDAVRTSDFVLAVHEAATNSVEHGGGSGTFRLWHDDAALVCEIRDRGRIDEPLVGRLRPRAESRRGRGLWMANHLCDLVQVRSSEAGTTVRLHMWRDHRWRVDWLR